jgi:hypothetical protein
MVNSPLEALGLGCAIGLAAAMALGIFPQHRKAPAIEVEGEPITQEDRERAREVVDNGCDEEDMARPLPPGWHIVQCGSVTVGIPHHKRRK